MDTMTGNDPRYGWMLPLCVSPAIRNPAADQAGQPLYSTKAIVPPRPKSFRPGTSQPTMSRTVIQHVVTTSLTQKVKKGHVLEACFPICF
jgi:hypothetical protein